MRFVLDNDVDEGCRRVLVKAGHECWTVRDAGRTDGEDADHAVYAHDKHAVFVSHDKEFARWRTELVVGKHVRICCHQIDGPDLLAARLPEVEALLASKADILLRLKPSGLEAFY